MPYIEEPNIDENFEGRRRLFHFWEGLKARGPLLIFPAEEVKDEKYLQTLRTSASNWGRKHGAMIVTQKRRDGSVSFQRIR